MSTKPLLMVFLVGLVLFFFYGYWTNHRLYWNQNIKYPAGVTTNAADITWGTGLPVGYQFIDNTWIDSQ